MMSANTPPSSPDNIYDLLSQAVNDQKARENLDRLTKATLEMNKTIEASRQAQIELDKEKAVNQSILDQTKETIEEARKQAQAEADATRAEFEALARAQQERELTVHNSEDNVANKFQELMAIKQDLDNRLDQVTSRENAISQREENATKREEAVSSLEFDLNNKLNQLKSIAGAS